MLGDVLCAIKDFNFTTAVVFDLRDRGYERRYCFEHRADATASLGGWNGRKHPGGPWIKCKGAKVDLLNPNFR
jgi:hypothetical protein